MRPTPDVGAAFERLMQLSEALAVVADIDIDAHLCAVRDLLRDVIGADRVVWAAVGDGGQVVRALSGDLLDPEQDIVGAAREAVDHPLIAHYRDRSDLRPRRTSDIATSAAWRATRAYAVCLPVDGAHALGLPVAADGLSPRISWTLLRGGRDFTDAERELAELVVPTIAALWHGAVSTPVPADGVALRHRGLTARQQEVLGLRALGLSARGVGRVLRISERTASRHLQLAYAALGVRDRVAAAVSPRSPGPLLHGTSAATADAGAAGAGGA